MIKDKRVLALIPARGGSKRLPGKNIKEFCRKPLIASTVEAANGSRYIDKIIVSTDSRKIARIAQSFDAKAPFIRPAHLAKDDSKTIDVVLHALNWIKEHTNETYDLIILLQPTSPLRLSDDIDKSIELLFIKKADSIISLSKANHNPNCITILSKKGYITDFLKVEKREKRDKDIQDYYEMNGAIYLAYCDFIKKQKSFIGDKTFAYIMPRRRSIDIDDEIDFVFAEFLKTSHNRMDKNSFRSRKLK